MPKLKCKCEKCGKEVYRYSCEIMEHVFCSRGCSREYLSLKMKAMNEELNPTRMTEEIKNKVRMGHLRHRDSKGIPRKSYKKYRGRHIHRIVAEEKLGRPLRPGEVVHHIDADRFNNSPENLMVFKSQAEHAGWHKREEVM